MVNIGSAIWLHIIASIVDSTYGALTLSASGITLTWLEARQACETGGGNLAIAGHGYDATELTSLITAQQATVGSGAYFGLVGVVGSYRWVNGAEVTDISGLPVINTWDRAKCVLVSVSAFVLQYTLNDCTPTAPYVCDSTLPPTPEFSVSTGNTIAYAAASAACAVTGWRLAFDDSEDKHRLITTFLILEHNKFGQYWFGARQTEASGPWVWDDGTPITSTTFWEDNEPNLAASEPTCVMLNDQYPATYGFSWHDALCNDLYNFVCENPASPTTAAVNVPPTTPTDAPATTPPNAPATTPPNAPPTTPPNAPPTTPPGALTTAISDALTTAISDALRTTTSDALTTTAPGAIKARLSHAFDYHVINLATYPTDPSLATEVSSVLHDGVVTTCMSTFNQIRTLLQITYNVYGTSSSLRVNITGQAISCGDLYLLVYYGSSSLTAQGLPVMRQCQLLPDESIPGISGLSECLVMCADTWICTSPYQVTIKMEAPPWAPLTQVQSQLCEVQFDGMDG